MFCAVRLRGLGWCVAAVALPSSWFDTKPAPASVWMRKKSGARKKSRRFLSQTSDTRLCAATLARKLTVHGVFAAVGAAADVKGVKVCACCCGSFAAPVHQVQWPAMAREVSLRLGDARESDATVGRIGWNLDEFWRILQRSGDILHAGCIYFALLCPSSPADSQWHRHSNGLAANGAILRRRQWAGSAGPSANCGAQSAVEQRAALPANL